MHACNLSPLPPNSLFVSSVAFPCSAKASSSAPPPSDASREARSSLASNFRRASAPSLLGSSRSAAESCGLRRHDGYLDHASTVHVYSLTKCASSLPFLMSLSASLARTEKTLRATAQADSALQRPILSNGGDFYCHDIESIPCGIRGQLSSRKRSNYTSTFRASTCGDQRPPLRRPSRLPRSTAGADSAPIPARACREQTGPEDSWRRGGDPGKQ